MALMMSCLMSLVVTTVNVGFVDNLISIWLRAWGTAFCIAFPAIVLLAPIARKLSGLILERDESDG